MRIPFRSLTVSGLGLSTLTVVLATATPTVARAEIVQCDDVAGFCASQFSVLITVDGAPAPVSGFGQLIWNEQTGEIRLGATGTNGMPNPMGPGLMWDAGGGAQATVGSLSGDADPQIIFGVGSSTGAAGAAFSFTFNLPISMSGQVAAKSSLGYSLTAAPGGFAGISPFGPGMILEALDVDTSVFPVAKIDKNVDVGPGDSFTNSDPLFAATQNFGPYTSAVSFFNITTAYDLMTVQLSYILSANTGVGLSGSVTQIITPIPAALPLLLSGLAGFGVFARRRTLAA
jgi:hypothetical protein